MCEEPLKRLLKHLFEGKEQGQIELPMIKVKGNYLSFTWFPLIRHIGTEIIHVLLVLLSSQQKISSSPLPFLSTVTISVSW